MGESTKGVEDAAVANSSTDGQVAAGDKARPPKRKYCKKAPREAKVAIDVKEEEAREPVDSTEGAEFTTTSTQTELPAYRTTDYGGYCKA